MKLVIECSIGNTLPKDAEPTEASEEYGCTACEYILNNRITRCSKFIFLSGKDPQNEDKFLEEGKCIDAWQPILNLEIANTNRGQTQTLESMRNETIKSQKIFGAILHNQLALENNNG